MKKLEVVVQGCKADKVREALAKEKIPRITLFEVKGAGISQGKVKEYRGVRYIEESADVKIEIVVNDDDAERLAHLIINALQIGNLVNGDMIIFPIEQNFRLRVGRYSLSRQLRNTNSSVSYLTKNAASFRSSLKALGRKFFSDNG